MTTSGNGHAADVTLIERLRPYTERVKAGSAKVAAVAQASRATMQEFHRDEPIALVNLLRFGLFVSCVAWKMAPTAMITTMAAGEALFTRWQRSQVSPRAHHRERREPDTPTPIAPDE